MTSNSYGQDTTISVRPEIAGLSYPNSVELGSLTSGSEMVYQAFGTGLSAGYRNAGLYRESQLTAFPNLLAVQMNARSFQMPVFSLSEGNGTGYAVRNRKGQLKKVSNNTAEQGQTRRYNKAPAYYNCIASPGLRVYQIFSGGKYGIGNPNGLGAVHNPLIERLLPAGEEDRPLVSMISLQKTVNFFTLELGSEDVMDAINNGAHDKLTHFTEHEGLPHETLLRFYKSKNAKGVILNVPDLTTLPMLQLDNIPDGLNLFITQYDGSVRRIRPSELVSPLTADSLRNFDNFTRGRTFDNPLGINEVVDENELGILRRQIYGINIQLERLAENYQFKLFDLNKFYQALGQNEYLDRYSNSKMLNNKRQFFSSDYVSLSTIGQVQLANEIIELVNSAYSAKIPFIDSKKIN